jgi:hypothetical protein
LVSITMFIFITIISYSGCFPGSRHKALYLPSPNTQIRSTKSYTITHAYSFTVCHLNMLGDFYLCHCYSQLFLSCVTPRLINQIFSQTPVQAKNMTNLRAEFLLMEEYRCNAIRDTTVEMLSIKFKD